MNSPADRLPIAKRLAIRSVQVAVACGLIAVIGVFVWDQVHPLRGQQPKQESPARKQADRQTPIDWRQIGDRAYVQRDWDKAADAYRHELKRHPDSLPALVRLAYSLHSAGHLDEALAAHVQASRHVYARSWALYNIACIYAVRHERELALDYLRQAIEAGFRAERPIREDPDLAYIVDDPEFARIEELSQPLRVRAVYRRLDFLIGRWTLEGREARHEGTFELRRDTIRFALIGTCLDTALPMTATLLSYYDPGIQKWRQLWLDSEGNVMDLTAQSRVSNTLVLEGTWIRPNGDTDRAKLVYTLQDQHAVLLDLRVSVDSGQTWETVLTTRLVRRPDV